jgi:hypothetical protein
MLVSKAAIRHEFGSRLAEFAPPGEQLQGLFVDERGQIPLADSTGTPVYVLLTTRAQMQDQQGGSTVSGSGSIRSGGPRRPR